MFANPDVEYRFPTDAIGNEKVVTIAGEMTPAGK